MSLTVPQGFSLFQRFRRQGDTLGDTPLSVGLRPTGTEPGPTKVGLS